MHRFDLLEHLICLSLPRRRVPFASWRQHIPFAMLLVDIIRPRTLVELGVHYGDSYCAFCQAVADLRLNTECYGVDTWKGDPHASYYGPEVLEDLVVHHDPLYASFSRLIQSTFDEAIKNFADGTIDLLHIDGYHTYKAVKHDFEKWLPKMSQRGVVLLHDVNEKQQDFGAWKVWDEINVKYPHFEFLHCHGLGIVAVGQNPPEELSWLFEASDERATAIRNFFFYLGDRLTDKMSSVAGQEPEISATGFQFRTLGEALNELQIIRSSVTWKFATKLHSVIKVLLPLGTKRRFFAGRLMRWTMHMLSYTKNRNVTSGMEFPDRQKKFVHKYIRGIGIVIGSLPQYLRIPANVAIDYVDAPSPTESSGDYSITPRYQTTGEHMNGQITKLEDASNEQYDFIMIMLVPESIKAVYRWLGVLKPGGIILLAVADDRFSPKVLSDFQSNSLGLRVLDYDTILTNGARHSIYVIQKANYVLRMIDIIDKSPQPVIDDAYIVDVIVPIYNAYEDLERCLYSLFIYQDIYRIILIDDCSTDKRVKQLLDTLKEHQCVRFKILDNEENIGYLKTVNRVMKMVSGDVILLNSDTVVTKGWANKMRACAYSRERTATVTPFTNNGKECSIPEFGKNNDVPQGFTIDSFAELVENCSIKRYPELVTAVGFCMYIRRAIIDEIGYLDEVNFIKGYGEEDEFSFRAMRKGYKNVLCDDTFIFHKAGASFLHGRNILIEKSMRTLERMYPDYWPSISLFHQMNPLKELHDNIKLQISTRNINCKSK